MTTIGFIGSGNIGSTLARRALAVGHEVVLSNSRGPQTLADLVAKLGDQAGRRRQRRPRRAGDLVVAAIPLKAYRDLPVDALAGKVVVDTGNYYPERDGTFAELEDESTTTSELVQAQLPGSPVVKAFNNIFFRNLAELGRPTGSPGRSALPIAGDDAAAKVTVTEFLDQIGYDAYDVGVLAEGWRYQRDTPAYVAPYADTAHDMASRPANAQDLAALLEAAKRYRDID